MDNQGLASRMQQIEGLIRKIESLPDPDVRTTTLELVQLLMEFHGAGLDRLMEIISEAGEPGYSIFDNFAKDELVGSLLLLYGLHPLTLEERVVHALDKVRPYLDSHGGNVELVGITDGVVKLRMQGSCKSCPSSAMTLKLAIEEAIYNAAPDVMAIEAEGVQEQPLPQKFVQIGRAAGNGGASAAAKGNGWEDVSDLQSFDESSLKMMKVSGRAVLFCKVGDALYAYDDDCPGCSQPLHAGSLEASSLICNGCRQRFDVIRAGRGLDQPELHLEPFPLLIEGGRAKVALPHATRIGF